MKKKNILLLSILISISFIFSAMGVLISNVDNQVSPLNITFTGNENQTFNITFYINANITGAKMNLSANGYSCYQESANQSSLSDGNCSLNYGGSYLYFGTGNWTDLGNIYDEDWNSYGVSSGGLSRLMINYTKPTNAVNSSIWMFKFHNNSNSDETRNFTIPQDCWDYKTNEVDFEITSTGADSGSISAVCYNATLHVADGHKLLDITHTSYPNLFEEAMIWEVSPTNATLSINNTIFWNFTGTFNQINNQTSDFASTLNGLLDGGACTGGILSGNNCTINFTFHSDTIGTLQVLPQITWLEYNKPNLTIFEPNTTYNLITYVPLNFEAADDYKLDTCWFNVTRGASLEVSNTYINCKTNTTFTVSGSAVYVLYMCVNDTSGNQNCTSTSFKTIDYILPQNPAGGGGGTITIIQQALNNTLSGEICKKREPAVVGAWAQLISGFSFPLLRTFWIAFWDYVTCKSAASIVPFGALFLLRWGRKRPFPA